MTLSMKENRVLIDSLQRQGAILSRTKKGYLVKFPNGSSTTIHLTNSDWRARQNMRTEIRRADLHWPFDGQERQHHKARDTTMKRSLSTDPRRAISIKKVRTALRTIKEPFTIAEVGRGSGLAFGTIKNVLVQNLGYEQTPESLHMHIKQWRKIVEPDYPEISAARHIPDVEDVPEVVDVAPVVEPEPVPAAELDFALTEPEPEPSEPDAETWPMVDVSAADALATAADTMRSVVVDLDEFAAGRLPGYDDPSIDPSPIVPGAPLPDGHFVVNYTTTREEVRDLPAPEVRELPAAEDYHAVAVAAYDKTKREFIDSVDSWTIPVPEKIKRQAERMGLCVELRVWHNPESA